MAAATGAPILPGALIMHGCGHTSALNRESRPVLTHKVMRCLYQAAKLLQTRRSSSAISRTLTPVRMHGPGHHSWWTAACNMPSAYTTSIRRP